jgi:hypothetical protein
LSYMFEVYYLALQDDEREARILSEVEAGGGHLDFWEKMNSDHTIILTYDFPDLGQAQSVMAKLQEVGEYVEGPQDYGD